MANPSTPYIAKAAAALVNPTTATIFVQAPNPLSLIAANTTVQSAFVKHELFAAQTTAGGASNGQNSCAFLIRAWGRATGGTTTNFTPTLYFNRVLGAANVPGTGTTSIGGLTATAFNTASGQWYLSAVLLWDATSGQISGTVGGFAGSGGAMTNTAAAAITPLTGQTLVVPATSVSGAYSTGELQIFFSMAGLFSATNANNVAYLDCFEVENL